MFRIYLDQKDYIRIAHGLLGDTKFKEDLQVYNFLLPLVQSENIKIYYSLYHLQEASGYTSSRSDYLDKYLEVLTSLTRYNCIRELGVLTEIEIELLLAYKFNFSTDFDSILFPFGNKGDLALPKIDSGFEEKLGLKLTKEQKYKTKSELQKRSLDHIRKLLPGVENFTKDEVILLVAGQNSPERYEIVKKYLDNVLDPQHFIKIYSKLGSFPKMLIERRDKKTDQMIDIIFLYQDEISKGDKSLTENEALETFRKVLIKEFENLIHKLSVKYNFHAENAKQCIAENIHEIRSIYIYFAIFKEYLKRHKMLIGSQNRPRAGTSKPARKQAEFQFSLSSFDRQLFLFSRL